MEERNSPSSRHWIVGVAPGIELLAAQFNIAALPGTTTESCGSSVNSSSDTPATKSEPQLTGNTPSLITKPIAGHDPCGRSPSTCHSHNLSTYDPFSLYSSIFSSLPSDGNEEHFLLRSAL